MTVNRRMTLTAAAAVVLTSTVLYPLFTGSAWLYAGAGAAIAVAASGTLSRLRVLPVVVCLAITVLGLLLYLNLAFEAAHSLLWVIPTPTSIARLWDLAGAGMTESRRYAPPAPDLAGLVLLATAGIGITAVATDLIAARLRSAALAGLPLLVLFTVPVTMKAPHGIGTVLVFCLGAAGYLAILSADGRERIRIWGKLVSLWRSGSLYEAAQRGPGRGAAAGNGAAVAGAADSPEARAGATGSGHQVLGPELGPDTRALAAAGRRVGLASIILALCVPLIVPGLHPSKLFSSGPGIGGSGGARAASAPPLPDVLAQTLTQLRDRHPTTVLTYTTTVSKNLQEEDAPYLQQYVLDVLPANGSWQTSDYMAGSKPASTMSALPPGLTALSAVTPASITVDIDNDALSSRSERTFLPILYPPTSVQTPSGTWLTDPDEMVFSQAGSATVSSYTANGEIVDPTAQELAAAPAPPSQQLQADLDLPQSYQVAALRQVADTITKGKKTEYAKVEALASWLSGPQFTYSSTAKLFDTPAGLISFLDKTRAGVCVQSAYAMTVLARLLRIPARVVQGYTSGTLTSGRYVVKTSDAHAWTEVYFPGYGWIRFEPTPGGQGTASRPNYMGPASGPGSTGAVPGLPAAPIGLTPTSPARPGFLGPKPIPNDSGSAAAAAGKSPGTPWAAIVLAVIGAIALACGVIAVAAPPTHRALASHQADGARQHRPVTLTSVLLVTAAAAIVALALYRVLTRTSGLDLRVGWATVGIAFGAACAVVLVTPAAGRIGLRRWRWIRATDDVSRAHTAWREFRDDLEDLGVGYRPSEPPRTLAERVTSGLPEPDQAAIRRLALAEERASYAARPSGSANLRRDGTAARRAIVASVPRASRWRARVFPASVLTELADTASRISDRAVALISRRWTERRSAS
jgi:transglutaminase-like putative cysteine protease